MAGHPFERIGRPRHADVLTPAEWEVLAGVREGLSNREIAGSRGCNLETVRFHLRNLRRKLSVGSRGELRAFPGRPAAAIERARGAKRRRRVREQIPLVETADLARLLAFYVDMLGFEIVSRWPDDGPPAWVALGSGGARLMLRQSLAELPASGRRRCSLVVPNFYVEDLDGFRRAIERAGHACSPTRRLFYGAREFDVRDPDGNNLVFVEFAASEPVYLVDRSGAKPARGRGREGRRR
jgi:DNA-binding CsgD family transcriptional regulator/uncharacterized glyoxalase superfamily protein PhnB